MLRLLIPGILLLAAVLDGALRMLPVESFALRSWEAVTMFLTSSGPFAPNKRYINNSASGDLGTLANLPQYRVPHPETFTTYRHGYRTYDPDAGTLPGAILFGDSFGAGASLTDDAYLCAKLGPVFGGPVFFGGYFGSSAVAKLQFLPKTVNVIAQMSERFGVEGAVESTGGLAGLVKRFVPERTPAYYKLHYVKDFFTYSPAEILAARAYRLLQNDLILPNIYAGRVERYSVANGAQMLFLRSESEHYYTPRQAPVDTLVAMRDALAADRIRLIVILVPDKFTVYYPLLLERKEGPPEDRLFINVLERNLQQSSVKTINLTKALRHAAAVELAQGRYVYHTDDTHWNAAGVAVAAEAIRQGLDGKK